MTHHTAGSRVLITGPARGIGAEVARRLAARGARLSLVGLEPERLDALAREVGDGHVWSECDVTDPVALASAVSNTVRALGGIDVVIANAGIASFGTVAVTRMEVLARVIDVNLTGVIRTVSLTLPHVIAARGYYLLVSSAASLAAMPGLAAYAAAKSGVEQFGAALRLEVAHKGVTVGTVHPCWIDTDLVRDPQHDLASFNDILKKLPPPFSTVTSLDECAAAIVAGVERRRRRIHVPRSLTPWFAVRHLFHTAVAEWAFGRQARDILPRFETEVAALSRPFGEHSVETTSPRHRTSDQPRAVD
jgi:short-subunit dehydrogenase